MASRGSQAIKKFYVIFELFPATYILRSPPLLKRPFARITDDHGNTSLLEPHRRSFADLDKHPCNHAQVCSDSCADVEPAA